jgi:uncharacterized protein with GYD domain
MLRWQYTATSAKGLVETPQDRAAPAARLAEDFGGKLHDFYFSFGDFDGMAICEYPDNATAAAAAMAGAASGAFARFETTILLTPKEAEAAMHLAHKTKTGFKPPQA